MRKSIVVLLQISWSYECWKVVGEDVTIKMSARYILVLHFISIDMILLKEP